jgi:hypothetical protein
MVPGRLLSTVVFVVVIAVAVVYKVGSGCNANPMVTDKRQAHVTIHTTTTFRNGVGAFVCRRII